MIFVPIDVYNFIFREEKEDLTSKNNFLEFAIDYSIKNIYPTSVIIINIFIIIIDIFNNNFKFTIVICDICIDRLLTTSCSE